MREFRENDMEEIEMGERNDLTGCTVLRTIDQNLETY